MYLKRCLVYLYLCLWYCHTYNTTNTSMVLTLHILPFHFFVARQRAWHNNAHNCFENILDLAKNTTLFSFIIYHASWCFPWTQFGQLKQTHCIWIAKIFKLRIVREKEIKNKKFKTFIKVYCWKLWNLVNHEIPSLLWMIKVLSLMCLNQFVCIFSSLIHVLSCFTVMKLQ